MGHALMENRNGLLVGGVATRATGNAEPFAAVELLKAEAGGRRVTVGADKAYDTADFVMECREATFAAHARGLRSSTHEGLGELQELPAQRRR